MNIFKHEFRLYIKPTLGWVLAFFIMLAVFFGIYPMFQDSVATVEKILSSFPEAFIKAMGFDLMNFTSEIGFLGFLMTYIILIGGIQAMNLGLSLLSNELRDKTADFLYSKPVMRINIIHSKILVGITCILITNILFAIGSLFTLSLMVKADFSLKLLSLFWGSLLLTQVFFLTFGMMVSVFMNKLKSVVPVSLGTVFMFFIINMLNESIEGRPLTPLTPFAYFHAGQLIQDLAYDYKWLLLNICLLIIFAITAYIRQMKKDIPSV
ncbi:ABC transporter permease [Acidaminobacter sp. JC074]|uniref:ABC transporter permease subunit n=1 Tax=Acidaminobacter sp. JC074 TaxID=2530199 RepID=UPI001F105B89|nr:ABC transporter permease subunit [Acidaminobacter sp. JC074]MCH4889190.1 ABC transporter permease [Acidaminobacter sp. JC074]